MKILREKTKLNIIMMIILALLVQIIVPMVTSLSFAEDEIDLSEEFENSKGTEVEEDLKDADELGNIVDSELFDVFQLNGANPKDLGNIFTFFELIVDGTSIDSDTRIEIRDNTTIELKYHWEIPNDYAEFAFGQGDWAEIEIPQAFMILQSEVNGKLWFSGEEVGTYKIAKGSNILRLDFNEKLVDLDERKGEVWINLKFNLSEFEENSIQLIRFNDSIEKEFTITLKPKGDNPIIDKVGLPNAKINATMIDWTIDVNTSLEIFANSKLEDIIPEGLELVENSIEVYNLLIGYEGTRIEGTKITTIIPEITNNKFQINLGEINRAYRIKYKTKIVDYNRDSYVNIANIYDGSESIGEVEFAIDKIRRDSSIDKSGFPENNGWNSKKITWNIDVNKSESLLENVRVNDNVDPTKLSIDNKSIRIFELNKSGDNWNLGHDVTDDLKNGDEYLSFPLMLGTLNKKAYRIVFNTDILYGEYKKINEFENEAILRSDNMPEDTSKAKVTINRDSLLVKEGKETTNYNDPHITWTVYVNKANHTINNAVLNDLIGEGLELQPESIKVFNHNNTLVPKGSYSIVANSNSFTINFGTINTSYKIVYTTKITDFNKTLFNNDVSLTGDGLRGDGIGEDGIVKIPSVPVNPSVKNSYTKSTVNKIIDGINYDGINYKDKTMSWAISIKPLKEKITELTITDSFPNNGLKFIKDSLKVVKGSVILQEDVHYSISEKDGSYHNGFVFVFLGGESGALPLEGGEYNIYYKTSFNPDEVETLNTGKVYRNKAEFIGKTVDGNGTLKNFNINNEASYTINDIPFNGGKKDGILDRDNRQITWKVYVNYMAQNLVGQFTVTDILGPGQELNENSIMVKEYSVNPNGSIKEETNLLTLGIDYTVEVKDPKIGFTLTFLNDIDKPYLIEYTTKIVGISNQKYTNKALSSTGMEYNGTTTTYTDHNNFLIKEAENVDSTMVFPDDEINWKVILNKSLSDIKDAKFADIIGNGLVFINDSLKVYKGSVSESNLVDSEKYTFAKTSLDTGETKLELEFGDINSAYIITYDTVVIATSGKVSNSASFNGENLTNVPNRRIEYDATQSSGGTGSGVNRGKIRIEKVDGDTSMPLVAEFELYYMLNGEERLFGDKSYFTNENGILEFNNLALRTYYLREVAAPEGYLFNDKPIEIKLSNSEKNISLIVENHLIRGNIELIKYGEDNDPLEGAEFTLYYANDDKFINPLVIATSDKDGKVEFKDIEYGRYKIKETKAPEGYLLWDEVLEATISEDKTTVITNPGSISNTKIRGNIEFAKYGEDKEPLEGAEFTLYYANDDEFINPLVIATSDKDGKVEFKDIEYGSYKVKETKAPEGYNLTDEILEVSIVENGKTIIPTDEGIANTRIRGGLEILKVIRGTTRPLSNAEFTLYYEDGTEIGVMTTGEDGIVTFQDLVYGKYYFIETKAPSGYIRNMDKHYFHIEHNGVVVKATLENSLIPEDPEGRIVIIKKAYGTNELLSGAEFDVMDSKGKVVDRLITNILGEATSKRLPVGTYIIKETKSPDGYVLSEEVFSKDITNGVTVEIIIFNEKEKPSEPTETTKPTEPSEPEEPTKPEGPETDEHENVVDETPEGTINVDPNVPTKTLPKTGSVYEIGFILLGFVALIVGIVIRKRRV